MIFMGLLIPSKGTDYTCSLFGIIQSVSQVFF
jgi:hypothetical protein